MTPPENAARVWLRVLDDFAVALVWFGTLLLFAAFVVGSVERQWHGGYLLAMGAAATTAAGNLIRGYRRLSNA